MGSIAGPQVVLPLLVATSGAHQGQVAVHSHCGAKWWGSTPCSCAHHGWCLPSSSSWGTHMGPKAAPHVVLPLLTATSGAHPGPNGCMWPHWGVGWCSALGLCGHCGCQDQSCRRLWAQMGPKGGLQVVWCGPGPTCLPPWGHMWPGGCCHMVANKHTCPLLGWGATPTGSWQSQPL